MDAPAPQTAAQDDRMVAGQERQRGNLSTFLFVSFVLFMLTNRNTEEALARNQYLDALESMGHQLSNYSAWINNTASNFTLPARDEAIYPLVESFLPFGEVLDPSHESYFTNITGYFHGKTRRHNLTTAVYAEPEPWHPLAERLMADANATEVIAKLGSWNWTASAKAGITLVDKMAPRPKGPGVVGGEDIAIVHGRLEFTDTNTGAELPFFFEGIHYLNNGSIFGLAEPNGHRPDIRDLSALVPADVANQTALAIEAELAARIAKFRRMIDAGTFEQDQPANEDTPPTTCALSLFLHLDPAPLTQDAMRELEAETQTPTGRTLGPRPPLALRGVVLGAECGLLLELVHTEGISSKRWYRKVTTYAGFAALNYLLLLVLLSRQIARSRTPSGIARVSRWSFLIQAVLDSVSFAGHATFSILADGRTSLALFAPAFLAVVLFVYEVQFALLIQQIQSPENVVIPPPQPAPPPAPATPPAVSASADIDADAAAPAAPAPPPTAAATALATPTRPSFLQLYIRHMRTDPSARLWLTMSLLLLLMVNLVVAPALGFLFTGTLYALMWVPQYMRCARRGRAGGLAWEYLIGTTAGRLGIAMYFFACPKNVLDVEPRTWIYAVAGAMCAQVLLLMVQDTLGPFFPFPASWTAPLIYDYHPPLPVPDAEAPDASLGDCSICMDAIVVDARGAGEETKHGAEAGGLLNAVQMGVGARTRKVYSLAPCHHLFHTECLERWMGIKNICPQCRRPLPPL